MSQSNSNVEKIVSSKPKRKELEDIQKKIKQKRQQKQKDNWRQPYASN